MNNNLPPGVTDAMIEDNARDPVEELLEELEALAVEYEREAEDSPEYLYYRALQLGRADGLRRAAELVAEFLG